ncbi:Immunity protein 22 [Comamonas aquatilis]|uniref:immunity 22 family protein n=1 Tax=Comamonas aquatilis TaxID=1778406 RepID=UPI0039F10BE4
MSPGKTWTLAFRKALVDEALHRTPTSGFAELEKRHDLRPGTLFDWVGELGPTPPPAPFSALHFWIGNTELNAEQFGKYFDHADSYWTQEAEDIESASNNVTGCGFCQDIDSKFLYDEDLMLVIHESSSMPVQELVQMSTLGSDESLAAIVAACAQRGITQANAMFVYADPTEQIAQKDKLYNGLAYIGLF